MKKDLVYLTGFMGSGKSTIGSILANALGWQFIDLDKVIEEKEGRYISEIFEEHGEQYFRESETKSLIEISKKQNAVISLGGGALISETNLKIAKESGILIYLKMSPESAYKRLKFKKDRPLLNKIGINNINKTEFLENVLRMMEKRERYYEQADYSVDTDKYSIGLTVDEIAKIVDRENNFNPSIS